MSTEPSYTTQWMEQMRASPDPQWLDTPSTILAERAAWLVISLHPAADQAPAVMAAEVEDRLAWLAVQMTACTDDQEHLKTAAHAWTRACEMAPESTLLRTSLDTVQRVLQAGLAWRQELAAMRTELFPKRVRDALFPAPASHEPAQRLTRNGKDIIG